MDCGSNTLSPNTLEDGRSVFVAAFFCDPVKATSEQLAPFRGYGFVEIVCNELTAFQISLNLE